MDALNRALEGVKGREERGRKGRGKVRKGHEGRGSR